MEISRKSRHHYLPRKTWFLMKARFEFLSPPLSSWCRNEFVGGLGIWFRVPIVPARKIRQHSNWQLTNCLEKRDFKQTTPNTGILYTVGNDFSPRLIIWDLPESKTSFGLAHCQSFDNPSQKMCFAFRPLFTINWRYHYDYEINMNLGGPWNGSGYDRWP